MFANSASPPASLIAFTHGGDDGPACLLCGHPHSKEWVRARHLHQHGEWVAFWRCQQCRCLYSDLRSYTYAAELPPGFAKFYIELGAGVEPMAQMVLENLPAQLRNFADVGCALGFAPDFVERALGVPAVGFEPNPMPAIAELRGQLLAHALDAQWLGSDARRFDLLLASEVIEHVDDPVGFAANVRAGMADTMSLAVFSTPDADSIVPEESPTELYSRLFPGEHRHLLTADMLRQILLRAGFETVDIVVRGGHLIATAGTAAALAGRQRPRAHWRERFQHYLREVLSLPDAASDTALQRGHAYRLLKSLVNAGQIEAARSWLTQTAGLAPWLDEDGLLCKRALERALSLNSFASYVDQVPSFLGPMGYHLAMLARLGGRLHAAQAGLERAQQLMQHEVRLGPFCFIESASLLGPARMESALLAWHMDQRTHAFEQWQTMDQSTPSVALFARAGARLALEANARADYATLARILEALGRHPHRSHGLVRALCDGDWEHCPPPDIDLVFDVWIARFHAVLNEGKPLASAQSALDCLDGQLARQADAGRQAKRERVQAEFDAHRHAQQHTHGGQAPALAHFVDQMWCDVHGVFVKGWTHAYDREIRGIHLVSSGRSTPAARHARPDVAPFFPEYPLSGDSGFSAYLPCPPFQPVELHVDVGLDEPLRVRLELPEHLRAADSAPDTPSITCMNRFRDLMRQRGGTVLVLGGRMGPDHPDVWADCLLPHCRVLRVDIHPGPGVDLVADAHALTQHFAPASVDAVFSSNVMEHLQAPWVIAAQISAILRPGGLTMHLLPQAWPLHAAPNDFWRMSDQGLKTLFGPDTGFEVLDIGMDGPARMHPPPQLRSTHYPSIEMPCFDAYLGAYVLARKIADLPADAIRWPGADEERAARAQAYPTDA